MDEGHGGCLALSKPAGGGQSGNCTRPRFSSARFGSTCRADYRRPVYSSHRKQDVAVYEGIRGDTMRRVVITGVGPITSVGIGRNEFWEAIKNKKSGITTISKFDASIFKSTNAA